MTRSADVCAFWFQAARRCPSSVAEFFSAIGLPIIEGYGLTETAPVLTVNPQDAPRIGTVGKAIPGVELRIADDGEILARGPNVMSGYYNKPEATAEVLRDGWFHTGDIGTLDADGYLTITDRKKDLLVTSGGKKIAPQPIEGVLKRSPLVAEAVVLGDRRKFAAALIVPDFAALERRLRDLGRPPSFERLRTVPSLVEGPRARQPRRQRRRGRAVQEIVDGLNRELSQFERIKKIRLLPREFSMASGELTPTLKVRRKAVEENWRQLKSRRCTARAMLNEECSASVNPQSRSTIQHWIDWTLPPYLLRLRRRLDVDHRRRQSAGTFRISRSFTTCDSLCASVSDIAAGNQTCRSRNA